MAKKKQEEVVATSVGENNSPACMRFNSYLVIQKGRGHNLPHRQCFYNLSKITQSIGTAKFFTDIIATDLGFVFNNYDLETAAVPSSLFLNHWHIQLVEQFDHLQEEAAVIYKVFSGRQDIYLVLPESISLTTIFTYANASQSEITLIEYGFPRPYDEPMRVNEDKPEV